jgi:hypothetical protein
MSTVACGHVGPQGIPCIYAQGHDNAVHYARIGDPEYGISWPNAAARPGGSTSTPYPQHPRQPCPECGDMIFSLPGGAIFYDDKTYTPHTCPKFRRPGLVGQYDTASVYEPIKVIEHYNLNFALGNVVKYVLRAGKKPGVSDIEDLEKARQNITFEIERRKRLTGAG